MSTQRLANSKLPDRIASGVLLLFSILLWIYADQTLTEYQSLLVGFGPDFVIKLLASALIILSAILLVQSFIKNHGKYADQSPGETELPNETIDSARPRRKTGVSVLLLMAAYTLLIEPIGFLPATVSIMSIVMWILGGRRWYWYVCLICLATGMQYIIENFVNIQLP